MELRKKPPLSNTLQVMGVRVLSHIYPSLEPKNAENPPKFRLPESPSPSTWGKLLLPYPASDWSPGPHPGL